MKRYAFGCLGLLLLGALAIGIGGCSSYNRLTALSQQVDTGWAQVQNVYQRRSDLIPNLVSTVSGAANFEKSTLEQVTAARASVGQVRIDPNQAPADAASLTKFQEAQTGLSSALSRLLVVAERYPDLKASANFRDLQAQLEGTENRITQERKRFNEVVQQYNTAARQFPGLIWARMFGFSAKPYFQAVEGAEKAPEVKFDFKGANPPAPK